MTQRFSKDSKVSWAWGAHRAEGKVVESFARKVSRTIKDAKVTREGSENEPAYLVRQDDGGRALKSHSELKPL